MARFGTGINPQLGAIDYSPYMQGVAQGAQSIGQGYAALGAGIGQAAQGIGQAISGYKEQKEAAKKQEASIGSTLKTLESFEKLVPELGEYGTQLMPMIEQTKMTLTDPNKSTSERFQVASQFKDEFASTLQLGQMAKQAQQQQATEKAISSYLKSQGVNLPPAAYGAIQGYEKTASDIALNQAQAGGVGRQSAPSGYQFTPEGSLAPIKGGPADKPVEDASFGDESGLRKELMGLQPVKNYDIVKNFYQRGMEVAKEDTAAGDIALIFSYMKVLDPTSVVREGEYATAENAAAIPTRIKNAYNKAIEGQRLQPKQREEYISTMGKAAKTQFDQLKPTINLYKKVAEKRKLDFGNIVPESYLSFPEQNKKEDIFSQADAIIGR